MKLSTNIIHKLDNTKDRESIKRQVIREHHGLHNELKSNIVHEYQQENKEVALLQYSTNTGLVITPAEEASFDDWLYAKADGVTESGGNKYLVFVCCAFHDRDKSELETHERYRQRAQAALMVYGYEYAIIITWSPLAIVDEVIGRDGKSDSELLNKLRKFYEECEAEKDDKKHQRDLVARIDNEDLLKKIQRIDEIKAEQAILKSEQDDLMSELIEFANGESLEINGRKLTLVERKGSVSYAKALKAIAPDADLSEFTGETVTSWRLT